MARADRAHTVLPCEPRSAAIARRFVNDTLCRWGWDAREDDVVQLLVSELVTNALVHARSDVRLDVGHHRARLRVSVEDHSTRQPSQREQSTLSVHGRGLQLVDALAVDWGVTQTRRGKSVWFELHWSTADRKKMAESARWAR
jgi:anti-sigma regulatory factor (Ser/Thr protein kinase)